MDGNILVSTRSASIFVDRNILVPTRSASVFVFVGSRFRIYGSRNEVSPSVSEEFRFYMELTRIYSVFNLHKICLKIDMFKNIPVRIDGPRGGVNWAFFKF